jgi:hypothetical protein
MASNNIKPIGPEELAQKIVACDERQKILNEIIRLKQLKECSIEQWNKGEINDADKDATNALIDEEIQKLFEEGFKFF